jgi:hypothetical protein
MSGIQTSYSGILIYPNVQNLSKKLFVKGKTD